MKMAEMYPSNWLKKEDATIPIHTTIRQVTQEQIKGERGNELKPVLHFNNPNIKPMVLNRGNGNILAATYGDDTNNWTGKPVEIYHDPNVQFAGKIVGGLRVRVPSTMPPWTYEQAQRECEKVGIGKDALVTRLRAVHPSGWNGAICTPIVQAMIAAARGTAPQQDAPDDSGVIPF